MDWQIIFVIASFVAMLGGMWKIGMSFKEDMDKVTEDLRKDLQTNVSLLFKRFDAHKEDTDKKNFWQSEANDKKYMRLDNCSLIQSSYSREMESVKETLKEMSRKLDVLLEERRHAG